MPTTPKPESGMARDPHKPIKVPTKIKETSPGIRVLPMPAKPKVSIQKDNAVREPMFNNRGAVKPWKPPGGRAASKGSSDFPGVKYSKRMVSADMGISQKMGYKKIG